MKKSEPCDHMIGLYLMDDPDGEDLYVPVYASDDPEWLEIEFNYCPMCQEEL